MSEQDSRFIANSYPRPLTPAQQRRAVAILGEWLEQPERMIARHLKEKPFRVGQLRALTNMLDVNITGASLVLDSERSGVSRRMLGASLHDGAAITTWGKKLVRLGLFCGYYAVRPSSSTIGLARTVYSELRKSDELVWCFRSSARLMYLNEPRDVAYEEARRQLEALWRVGQTPVDAFDEFDDYEDYPQEVQEGYNKLYGARYPRPTRFDRRLTWSALRDGVGAHYISHRSFDRFLRDETGWLVVDGDNTGATFVNCKMSKVRFTGKLDGAKFINCTFEEVDFMTPTRDVWLSGCRGSVFFSSNEPEAMRGMNIYASRLEVRGDSYSLVDAHLVRSALITMDFILGETFAGFANSGPFGTAHLASFGRMCELPAHERAAMFKGMQLVDSFIDVPFEFFGDALRDAMTPEDYEEWEKAASQCRGTAAYYRDDADGCVKATGLMGDALAPLYFPDMMEA